MTEHLTMLHPDHWGEAASHTQQLRTSAREQLHVKVKWMEGKRLVTTTVEDAESIRCTLHQGQVVDEALATGAAICWNDDGNVWVEAAPKSSPKRAARSPVRRKLRKDDVMAIRSSNLDPISLAERYGVTPRTIYRIRRGEAYADV